MIRFFSFCFTLIVSAFALVHSTSAQEQDTAYIRSLIKNSEKYWYNLPDSSIILLEKAMSRIDTVKDKQFLSLAYTSFGTAWYMKGDYDKGLDYYFDALSIDEIRGDRGAIGVDLNNIGNIFLVQSKYEKAHEYFSDALKIKYALNDKKGVGQTLLNITNLYIKEGEYDIALINLKQSQLVFDSILDKKETVVVYTTFGIIYNSNGKPEEALKYFDKALKISEEIGDFQNEVILNINSGNVYIDIGKVDKAIHYFEEALFIAQEINYLEGLTTAFEKLYLSYELLGLMEESFQYYKVYILMRDSLQRRENTEAAVRNELEYNFEKERLLAKMEQEKKDVLVNEKEKQQNLIILGIFILLCGAFVIVYLIYRSNREKQKTNVLLKEKNKNITDSIRYAENIQHAILIPIEDIKKALPGSFVLFKPKDIVSGDFYFFTKVNQYIIIAVCDCTGHGVPGAFMSMIGSQLLNEIVNNKSVTDAAQILNQLRDGIIHAFGEAGATGEQKDGMDMVLCCIQQDKSGNTLLQYAGANNPLYIMREGGKELIEVKADKQPVGYTDDKKPFTNHDIQLQKGDTFYISSDGYQDQFGGPKGKKFMSKQFKQLFSDIKEMSMEEQKVHIDKTIEEWKGNEEQVDDILVIGVRV